ncbi:MAG: aldehyde dehydrogenase family protein [Zetaproteobacteria bacterium]|nr:MAG: aldehyde dehydrogenase family protein [Zetaproteobacteria bacterium]
MRSVFVARNPYTGKVIGEYRGWSEDELKHSIRAACRAQRAWREESVERRASLLRQLAHALEARAEDAACVITAEMGKPIREARAEVAKCAKSLRVIAERAPEWLRPRTLHEPDLRAEVRYAPLGVILGVMPWNFPFWQVVRFAGPAVAAGNGCVIKHAPSTPGCAEMLDELFTEVFGDLVRVGVFAEGLVHEAIGWPEIAGASLTGSVRAGRAIAETCGRHLKPCVLELGGSDPYLVLDDVEIEAVAQACVAARMINSGQTCIAAKRWIVHARIADAFTDAVRAALAALNVGDPMDEATDIGPLARADLRDRVASQVDQSVAQGARIAWQGEAPSSGFFYPPTLLADVCPGMPAWDEELFGPVAALAVAADEDEMLVLANHSAFGLGGGVFSGDPARAERLARRLQAGVVGVNRYVVSDPRVPFGGVKASGYGRELGPEGVRAFTNVQTLLF